MIVTKIPQTETETYLSSHYNDLIPISKAQHHNLEGFLHLRDALIDHSVGLCRLHNHFVLQNDEKVLTKRNGEGFCSQVSIRSDCHPWQWRFVNDKWVPVEYYEGPPLSSEINQNLTALKRILALHFAENVNDAMLVGVCANLDSIFMIERHESNLLETTDEENRCQYHVPVFHVDPDAITTRWFGPSGMEAYCKHSCRHACRSHGK